MVGADGEADARRRQGAGAPAQRAASDARDGPVPTTQRGPPLDAPAPHARRGDEGGPRDASDPRLPRQPPPRLPRRKGLAHWLVFAAALASLGALAWHMFLRGPEAGPLAWLAWADAALCAAFAAEFFTRSGWRRERLRYLGWHLFDFVAMVPALLLAGHGLPYEAVGLWLVLLGRAARVVNRLVGDGFIENLAFVVVEAAEEELTDRILLRILTRIEDDLSSGSLGRVAAEAMQRNRDPMLRRVEAEVEQQPVVGQVVHLPGVAQAVRQAEERTFDSATEVLASREVDQALRALIDDTFSRIRDEVRQKHWRERLKRQMGRV